MAISITSFSVPLAHADETVPEVEAYSPIIIRSLGGDAPTGLDPATIRGVYAIPNSRAFGTIAIIDAYDDPTIENDLAVFSKQFSLPACTSENGCFEKHKMDAGVTTDTGWAMEMALDVEWAHAIAPKAHIVLIEAKTASLANLLKAVDYASARTDLDAISISWGTTEFSNVSGQDNHFVSASGASYFASAGDNGHEVLWPAVSKNVIGVGGTTLHFNADHSFKVETAWSGSGGGLSRYEPEPAFQVSYSVPSASNRRAVPDVSYNADPASGYSIYSTTAPRGQKGWATVGGTSAGAPQWAALRVMSSTITLEKLYRRGRLSSYSAYFRDITEGSNGNCGFFCNASIKYDYVTGLGSPIRHSF